jgi:hypothetical protein
VCGIGLELFRGGGDLDIFFGERVWVSVLWALVWSLVLEIKVRTLPESKKNVMHGRTDRDVLFCRCSLRNFVSSLFLPPFEILPSEKPKLYL